MSLIDQPEKKSIIEWLNNVDYSNDDQYIPSQFALEFVNFIKLVNGTEGESNKTPIIHYKMIDKIAGGKENTLNMLFRGAAKALTLDSQIMTANGNVAMRNIKVGDLIYSRTGKLTKVLAKSEVFYKPIYIIKLVDGRELKVSEDHLNIVQKRKLSNKKWGWEEKVLTTSEILKEGVNYRRKVSYRTPTGKEAKWYVPTAEAIEGQEQNFPIDPYTVGVILGDGNIDKCGHSRVFCHIDDLPHYLNKIPYTIGTIAYDKRKPNVASISIKKINKLVKKHVGTESCYYKRVPQALLWDSYENRLALLRGLMDTDGTVSKNRSSSTSFTTVSRGLADDVMFLVRSLGGEARVKKNLWNGYVSFRVHIRLNVCPFSLERKAKIWTPNVIGRTAIESIERTLDEPSQCIMVEDPSKSFLADSFFVTHNTTVFGEYLFLYIATYGSIPGFGKVPLALYVSDSIDNGVKNMRRNLEYRWSTSDFLQQYVPTTKFTDVRWEFTNLDGSTLIIKGYSAKSDIRGSKEMGTRPVLAVLDDLVSDEDARSPTVINTIEDTVYKAIDYALDPQKRKVIWNGTPFNANDPLYKAAESGAWYVNVYPVCEEFPCSKEEFRGAWSDRFTYEYVQNQYIKAKLSGKLDSFNQELMLRIMSDEDRLVLDSDIVWFKISSVVANKGKFNFYITTDFATSEGKASDYSVISVWAYNNNGDWLLVDGICKRQLMDKNIDDLFRLVQIYKPQQVGIEVSGQQGGFIPWLYEQMMTRNIYFSLASENNNGKPGIRPNTNKMERFNVVLPWFKTRKIWLPEDMKDHPLIVELLEELKYASMKGFKSKHDDVIDTVSMLGKLTPWKPTEESISPDTGIWVEDDLESTPASYSSYIV